MEVKELEKALAGKNFLDDSILGNAEALARNLGKINETQLRKFYNQVLSLKRQMNSGKEFDSLKPQLRVIQAQLAYARGRKNLITEDFQDFFNICIKKILEEGENSLKDFFRFMEVVYAYSYCIAKE